MFTLIAENKYGQQLELTHNDAYVITSIDGLDPPDAVINTTRNANADGSVFNSSYVDNRLIIITLSINGPAEDNRLELYRYFKVKYPVKLYYKNEARDVYIDGYVRNITINFFNMKQVAQITVFCPEPYFNGKMLEIEEFSNVEKLFEFPFEIVTPIEFGAIETETEKIVINYGDVESGCKFILEAKEAVVNPTIYNTGTSEFYKLNITMARGDEITINTMKKQKSVMLLSNGVTTNIIGNLVNGSTWFQLLPGDNLFLITADTGAVNLEAYCLITNRFEGV